MYITRTFILVLIISYFSFLPLLAQIPPGGSPCPRGENVTLDTVFYSPDKMMPFDRCFLLKYTLKGTAQIEYFAITPIDKVGQPKFRRRDYRIFIKSGWPNKQRRRNIRKQIPYEDFKSNPINRLSKRIRSFPKGKDTEIFPEINPLDPNRDYRIVLIGKDSKSTEALIKIGELVFKSQESLQANPIGSTAYNVLRAEAKREHNRNLSIREKQNIPFRTETFEDFLKFFASFTIEFNNAIDTTVKEYRFFFTPKSEASLTSAQAILLDSTRYLKQKPKVDPERIVVTLPIKDSKGMDIYPYKDGNYQIHLLSANYRTSDTTVKPSDKKAVDFFKLGDLQINKNGTEYIFTVDNIILDGKYIKLDHGPIGKYRLIKDAMHKIDATSKTTYSCFHQNALQNLMDKALIYPGVEKGIKDLTLKDDLTRTLSILFEQQANILKNVHKGLISLKDPNTLADSSQYIIRKSNIQNSLEQVDALLEYAREIRTSKGSDTLNLIELLKCIEKFKTNLSAVADNLEIVVKAQADIESKFIEEFNLYNANPAFANSTNTLDFKSESKVRIVPDFGFIALFKGDKTANLEDFTPYLGFHINFRPIDKNIPMRMVRYKSLRYHLSFMSGITLRSLKIENKRDDFFGNSSLITGLGFRLNNYFRITGGTVWFKTTDINPLSENRPLRFSPFLGLSLDIEIQELFGGIKTLFNL